MLNSSLTTGQVHNGLIPSRASLAKIPDSSQSHSCKYRGKKHQQLLYFVTMDLVQGKEKSKDNISPSENQPYIRVPFIYKAIY